MILLILWHGIKVTFDAKSNIKIIHGLLLGFENIQIALVTPGQHPPHFAVVDKSVANQQIRKHIVMGYIIFMKRIQTVML